MEAQGKKRGKTLFSFFKPSASATATPTPTPINEVIVENPSNVDVEIVENQCVEPISKVHRVEIDLNTLERDPGIQIPIWQHPVNLRDDIRRAYIKMVPYQPKLSEMSLCLLYTLLRSPELQLALVGASSKEVSVWLFFSKLSTIVNLIGCSPKWHTELHSVQAIEIARMVTSGERDTGRGINQIGNLHRSGSTRWSSHFDSICSLIDIYGATMSVLQSIVEEGSSISLRGEAAGSLIVMESFDFIFTLCMMHKFMGITDLLCRAL
ncbi:hypothetical protein POM88_032431 [Heracleum sosnowskyi]|uniref:Uncharacterized protein n=1 Tax=Heracleum sosnowskyi TaxID=360622 RepID=A0AAD8I054_9APIA|nr:hypothetical protein POM88_032431 [Heracleum sosnowskyi]